MTQGTGSSRRIVVGIDGSAPSMRALEWALGQAKATGSGVEAVHAWEMPTSFGMAPAMLPYEDLDRAAQQTLATAVERATDGHPEVPVERQVVQGHPATVLVERSAGADLLVVGSHGHGGFVGALIGSVSLNCVQHATCPVVVVRGT